MKKLNYINIVFFIVIFLVLILISLSQPLVILDEVWNYNIARNIANGLIPYKDISMITTPFFGMITAFFLKITTDEIIVTRFLNSVMITVILYFIYKIIQKLKVNEEISHFCIAIFLYFVRVLFTTNYNILISLLSVVIIYLELNNLEKNNYKFDFFIGFISGIAICTKHTMGAIILFRSFIL